jgi:hypothetical protein
MALKITGEDPAAQHQETGQSEKKGYISLDIRAICCTLDMHSGTKISLNIAREE